jgi:hypothetical protein
MVLRRRDAFIDSFSGMSSLQVRIDMLFPIISEIGGLPMHKFPEETVWYYYV